MAQEKGSALLPGYLEERENSQVVSFEGCMMQHIEATLVPQCEVNARVVDQQVYDVTALFAYGIMQRSVSIGVLQYISVQRDTTNAHVQVLVERKNSSSTSHLKGSSEKVFHISLLLKHLKHQTILILS